MSITRPQEMTAGIDALGNTLAFLYSDGTVLQSVCELFAGTVVGNAANALSEKPDGNFALFAPLIKTFIANDCLRSVQFAIYADNVVEASELDAAYPIIKPLASFYQQHIGDLYKRFENLQREGVFDFLHAHMTDPGPFGGKVRQTKAFYTGKRFDTKELLALQTENLGLCLSVAGDILLQDEKLARLCFDLANYPFFVILSEEKRILGSDVYPVSGETKQLDNLIRSRKVLLSEMRERINKPMQVSDFARKSKAAGKILQVSDWWKNNKFNVPNVSHFPDSWFVDAAPVPIPLASNAAPIPCVAPISIQGSESPDDLLKDALKELNALEGLPSVKKEINNLVAFLKIQKKRAEHGLKISSQALHYVFHGNPGTGKTTVARILAKIFFGFGVLKTANFIETDRSGLVAGYVGQTAIKTDEIIQSSLDGVLFIDEAYALSRQEAGQDFGQEAVETLLKRMEDHRERLIVIVAGYPMLMRQFLQSNPGLSSRFTRSITFEDYTVPEMCRIFANICKKEEYTLSKEALAGACILFSIAHSQKDEHFGNARFVRNVYESTTMKQSARLAAESEITRESLATLEQIDIPFDMVPGFDAKNLDFSESRWRAVCPGCQTQIKARLEFVARQVRCKKCDRSFEFPWWSPIPATIGGVPPEVFG